MICTSMCGIQYGLLTLCGRNVAIHVPSCAFQTFIVLSLEADNTVKQK